ncbi:MAG: hypothetical protein QW222_05615 [Candidatus Bathyarchaeia archaeon]
MSLDILMIEAFKMPKEFLGGLPKTFIAIRLKKTSSNHPSMVEHGLNAQHFRTLLINKKCKNITIHWCTYAISPTIIQATFLKRILSILKRKMQV